MNRYFHFVSRVGVSLLLTVLITSCSKNYFQGQIVYRYQYIDDNGNDITERMKKEEDAEQYYFINPKNYKSKNEKGQLTQLYNSSTNQYYYNVGLELQKVDAATEFPKSYQSRFRREVQTILDLPCKSFWMKSEAGETTYFYSEKIKINPAPFAKHRFGNWNLYLKQTNGALPLKFVVQNIGYTLFATAVKITPMKLSNEEFELKRALAK